MSWWRFIGAAGSVALLSGGLAWPVEAGTSWSSPHGLSRVGVPAFAPAVAAAGNGDATVLWRQATASGYRLLVSRRADAGGWSHRVRLPGLVNRRSSYDVAMGATGTTVVWTWAHRVWVSRSLRDADWSRPVALNRKNTRAREVDVAMNHRGAITVVWAQAKTRYVREKVVAVKRPAGGHWGRPTTVSGATSPHRADFSPRVAMGARGTTTVAWLRYVDGAETCTVAVARRTRTAARWPMPTKMPHSSNACRIPPWVAMNRRGDAALTWEASYDEGGVDPFVVSAVRPRGDGSWHVHRQPEMPQYESGQEAGGLAIDEAGDVGVTWLEGTIDVDVVRVARRPAGGPWADPISLPGTDPGDREARIAMGGDGTTTSVWTGSRPGVRLQELQAAQRPVAGGWSQAQSVSKAHPDRRGGSTALVMDSSGNAVAVWLQRVAGSSRVMVATHDAP